MFSSMKMHKFIAGFMWWRQGMHFNALHALNCCRINPIFRNQFWHYVESLNLETSNRVHIKYFLNCIVTFNIWKCRGKKMCVTCYLNSNWFCCWASNTMNVSTVPTIDFPHSVERRSHQFCCIGYGPCQAQSLRSDHSTAFFRALELFDSAWR